MGLRRGFKTEANQYARELRAELELAAHDPLCPFNLARHLSIPIRSISDLADHIPKEVQFFRSGSGRGFVSAFTLFYGMRRVIVHNDGHDLKRQAANIAHEIAHAVLLHPPRPPFQENGDRDYDKEQEDEANWLGPALLISEEAALWIARNRMSISDASDFSGVSKEIIQMRLNVCGALRRISTAA